MKQLLTAAQILALSFLLFGCSTPVTETQYSETIPALTEAAVQQEETKPVLPPEEKLLHTMSLRERVGQLFMIRPDALNLSIPFESLDNSMIDGESYLSDSMKKTLELYPVGGFVQFQKNIISPEQIKSFNRELQESLYIPPFLSVDEEGGLVARLANSNAFDLPRFESAGSVGKEGADQALSMGLTIGDYLSEYGFNMDFAPVADVNTNPNNPVIGSRAFSSDPEQAAECARAMADGLRMNGIIPVFKHFPGHGNTAEDSHRSLAVSRQSEQQLDACEWIPFRQADSRESIMVGHIALPEVTGNMEPATFSEEIVTGKLRTELSFDGLVITDSLSMGAIIENYDSGEAALNALNAGCDILLMPQNLEQAFNAVLEAVESGSFPEETLNRIVLRILRVKLDYHMIDAIP